ncbi:MAG: cupin domain-containing protein [Pseudomonadales bacterium]
MAAPQTAPVVMDYRDQTMLKPAAGVELLQLIGPQAQPGAQTDRGSITLFRLAPGRSSGWSYSRRGEEAFLVRKGIGQVWIDDYAQDVGPGSYILVPPGVVRSVHAAATGTLEFYAITMPAWRPGSDVAVSDPRVTE